MTYKEKLEKVRAEIEKRFDNYHTSVFKHYDAEVEAKMSELGKILTIMDSMHVEE